jgi:NAD(P)H-nitrite reductase large subunit
MPRIERAHWDIIVVGNGIAGFSAAKAAREKSADRSVLLVGEEDRLPYKRTKLSKSIASGFERDAFQLRPADWYASHGIELMVGRRVTAIDVEGHRLALDGGAILSWDKLVLATGATPVRPAFVPDDLPQVFLFRSAALTDRLIAALRTAQVACVVGMGVLGVEVAAELVTMNKEVRLVGDCDQLMPRQLNRTAAEMLQTEFATRGVELVFRGRVADLADGGARALRLHLRERSLQADVCVFCVGVMPNVSLAAGAGLRVGRGILVDERMGTSHPDVYAAGDVSEHTDGTVTGLWHAAESQGGIAGANAVGGDLTNPGLPFRLKCEVFGRYFFSVGKPPEKAADGFDLEEHTTGSMYRCLYLRDGLLHGVVMVDDADRAKAYERAVRERWTRERTLRELG